VPQTPIEFALILRVSAWFISASHLSMPFTSPKKTAASWLVIGLSLVLIFWLLAPVLTPFLVAAVLAYALTPLVDRLDALWGGRLPRLLAVVLVELGFVLAVLGLLLLMVPILAKELPQLKAQVPLLLDRLNVMLQPVLAQLGIDFAFDVASLKPLALNYLNTNFEETMGSLLASLKLGGSVALVVFGNAVLIPVALFYLLMDWKGLVGRLLKLVPPRLRRTTDSFTADIDAVLGQYLRGQLLVMLILAGYYSLGLSLFHLELALPIGIFTGLAIFVPYIGFGLGLGLALLAGLLEFVGLDGASKALLMVAVVYGAGQLIESFFLTPRLVGERIGLHPLAVIFALLAFGQLLGFVGVLIALPASAVLLVAARRMTANYLRSGLYQGDSHSDTKRKP
jgi:predicted PurR-regulated permease PerM